MKIERIFLDLDDVLNCFTMSALQYLGCPVTAHDSSDYDPAWGWDIVAAVNALHPTRQFTTAEFWESIPRNFWANVPKSRECDSLLRTCAWSVGPKNVCILSSPTLDPDCMAGKLEWIQRTMPTWLHRQFLVGPCKQFCAGPRSLLIDDGDHNIEAFREAGGMTFLIPRPWNVGHKTSHATAMVRLRQLLNAMTTPLAP